MTSSNWDSAAGVSCRTCGNESFRLLEGQCIPCLRKEAMVEEEALEQQGWRATAREELRRLAKETVLVKGRAALLKATCWRCSDDAALVLFQPVRGTRTGKLVCNGCGTYEV